MLKFGIFNAANEIVNADGTPTRPFYQFCRALWNIFNNNIPKISTPSGGDVVDAQARQAIEQILNVLEQSGLTNKE